MALKVRENAETFNSHHHQGGASTLCKIRVHLNQIHTVLHLNRTHITTPKPWTDSNRHIVGDDLLGVPNNSAQTGRRGRRPLRQDAVEQILLLRSVVTVHHHKVREIQKAPTRVPLISVVYFDFTEYLIRQALSRRYLPCLLPTPRRAFSGDGGRVSPVR